MGIRFRKSNDDTVSPKKRDKNTWNVKRRIFQKLEDFYFLRDSVIISEVTINNFFYE